MRTNMKKHVGKWIYIIVGALVLATGCWPPGLGRREPAQGRWERSEFLMDTHVTITWYGDQEAEAVNEAFATIEDVEKRMSVYEIASEVAAINAAAGQHAVKVSDDTFAVIALAIRAAELTEGSFDPTIFPLVELWEQPVPRQDEISERLALVDYRQVRLDADEKSVELPRVGMALDLGGIAKGHAVDRAAAALLDGGILRALVDAGGDLYALGRRSDGTPWRIAVQHPRRPDQYLAILPLAEQAVVTSGDYQRYTDIEGVRYHHIYDPRTGWPADSGLISVTVVAQETVWADALSTALFVLGYESAMDLVEGWDGVEALIVSEEGESWVSSGLVEKAELLDW